MLDLIDKFNQFIVEHGSSIIQEKHITLFRDQLSFAEKEIVSLELKSQNNELLIKQLQEKISNQEKIINKQANIINKFKQTIHDEPLDKNEINILLSLFSEPHTTKELAAITKLNEEVVKCHLEKIKDKKLTKFTHVPMVGNLYSLDQNGREYLIKNQLI